MRIREIQIWTLGKFLHHANDSGSIALAESRVNRQCPAASDDDPNVGKSHQSVDMVGDALQRIFGDKRLGKLGFRNRG